MTLKNYTTSIKIEKSISEIEQILASNGATHLFKMYNDDGVPIAVAFKTMVDDKSIGFKLPMEEDKILQLFKNDNLPPRYNNRDQARRTGWRIIRDWVYAQMALIQINLVTMDQVFLPYMFDEKQNKTMYEMLKEKKFNLLLE